MSTLAEDQARWLAHTPAERAAAGPGVMAACADALTELGARLRALDYPAPILTPCEDLDGALAELEDAGVPVPPPLRLLWEGAGEVCLVDFGGYRHVRFWDERVRTDRCCDGIVVEGPAAEGWVDYQLDELEAQAEAGDPPGFVVAPGALHKDDVSGGDPYEVVPSPDDPWLPTLRGFDWSGVVRPSTAPPGAPDLVSYLRVAVLECGGFPGLLGSEGYEPIREELVAGLPVF